MHFPKLSFTTSLTLLTLLTSGVIVGVLPGQSIQVLAQTQDDQKSEADRIYHQGIQQYETSQFRDALQSLQQALSLYQKLGEQQSAGSTLSYIGAVHHSLEDFPQALEYYQQALVIFREVNSLEGEGNALNNIGEIYREQGQYSQALEFFQQASAIFREAGSRAGEGTVLNNIGLIYYGLEQYSQALKYFQQSLVIARTSDRAWEGTTLKNIGLVYDGLEQYPQALEYFQQALAIQQEIGDRQGEANTLVGLGELHNNLGQFSQALEFYQQALSIYQAIDDRSAAEEARRRIEEISQAAQLGGWQEFSSREGEFSVLMPGIPIEQVQPLQLEEGIRDQHFFRLDLEGRTGVYGVAYISFSDVTESLNPNQINELLDAMRDGLMKDRTLLSERAITLESNLGREIEFEDAESIYKSRLYWARQRLYVLIVARPSTRVFSQEDAQFLESFKLLADSSTNIPEPLNQVQTIQDRSAEANLATQLSEADHLFQQGFEQWKNNQQSEAATQLFEAAVEAWQQALALCQENGDRPCEAAILNKLGGAYHYLKQDSQSLESHQQALDLYREIGDRAKEGETLWQIGEYYRVREEYSKAAESYQQALPILREVGDLATEYAVLNNLGTVYNDLGQNHSALAAYQQQLRIAGEESNRALQADILKNIGREYSNLGQYQQALEYHQQSLAIHQELGDRTGEGSALWDIGSVYVALGHYPQALEYFQQALSIIQGTGNQLIETGILNSIGFVYADLRQYSRALEYFQQALSIVQKGENGNQGDGGVILSNLGTTLFLAGQLEVAETTLLNALAVLDSLRQKNLTDADRISLFERQVYVYSILQQVQIAQNKVEPALEVSERGRARAFFDLLSRRVSPEVSDQSSTISAPTIEQIKQIAQEQNATLVQYSITRAPFQVDGKEEWRQSNLYIWVVKPTGEVAFRSVDLTATDVPLNVLVNLSRQAIGARGRGSTPQPTQIGQQPEQFNHRFHQLYEILIAPIADLLPSDPNEHVTFIPQNELFLVPFPALMDANGQYLIEHHTILTAPSIQVLGLTQQLRQKSPTKTVTDTSQVLVVGNPAIPSQLSLSNLPGAEQEAIAIAQQFQTQPLLGAAATEPTVIQRMASARIIHLATHGLLEYGNPAVSDVRDMPGAIVLARAGQADGLLTSGEISTLDLAADLVVLSACDTGRGDITGDGVIGLSRALISAGAPSVIVSLWNVQDDSTEMLMSEFYRQLQQQPDKAQALRQAMLKTMAEYPNPHDWAAFTLIGEAE